jgi:3-hydroxyisobutyrate dehydrogenase
LTDGPAQGVGFIGLGIMGSRMAANLVRAGHEVTVWNRTREKAVEWSEVHGGTVADTPARAASQAVDGAQVDAVLLGPDGVVEGAPADLLCVDMSTIAPSDTRRIGAALAERGVALMDAPVTGSAPKAEDGTLTIMAGGDRRDFERALPLFEVMGEVIVHVGELGHGEMIKLISNAVAAANAVTVAQALIVGKQTGVDLDALERVMGAGAAGSTMLALKAGPMRRHDYETLFKLEHMLKDVRLCLEEGQAAGVPFPSAAAAREVLTAGMARDLGDNDFAALIEVLEGLAGARL